MPIKNPIGLGPGLLPSAGFGGGYSSKVLSIEPANLIGYYPMDELEGSVAFDRSGKNNHGVYTGATLGQPGIGDGSTCPFFNGTDDFMDFQSAGWATAFGAAKTEGSLMIWAKVSAAGDWEDAAFRRVYSLRVADGSDFIVMLKYNTNNRFDFVYTADGTSEAVTASYSDAGWMCLGMTWSKSGVGMTAYKNGAQEGPSQAIAGTWSDAVTESLVASWTGPPSQAWKGYAAQLAVWKTPLPAPTWASLAVV